MPGGVVQGGVEMLQPVSMAGPGNISVLPGEIRIKKPYLSGLS
jgi:hypothetical protein